MLWLVSRHLIGSLGTRDVGFLLLSPKLASLRDRLGAFALHAKHDARETTAAGRAAFLARFEIEVDPEGILPTKERKRRALYARKAYLARPALQSAKKRAQKKQGAKRAP